MQCVKSKVYNKCLHLLVESRCILKGCLTQNILLRVSELLPLSLLMSSACVLPLDIHAMVRDSSTPIGTATIARRQAASMSYSGTSCSDVIHIWLSNNTMSAS